MARIAVRLIIRGRVQGVGYRWWARVVASGLRLSGWVRNRADGAVELLAAGPAVDVEHLVAACQRGPSAARVVSVERHEATDPGPGAFEERSTA
ncbi:MAG TPA: acylphosphatase [Caulobacteraceae bacterium]|jgi:acylphosphatase